MERAIRDEEPAVTSPPSPEIYRDCVSSLYLPATALLRGDNRFGFFSVVESRQLFSKQALTRQPALLDGESVIPGDYFIRRRPSHRCHYTLPSDRAIEGSASIQSNCTSLKKINNFCMESCSWENKYHAQK